MTWKKSVLTDVNRFVQYVGANYHDGDNPMERPKKEREYRLDLFEMACLWNAAIAADDPEGSALLNTEDYE